MASTSVKRASHSSPGGRGQCDTRDLEAAGYFHAIRLPAKALLKDKIAHRLTRPVGRPSQIRVKRFFVACDYQAAPRDKERRVITNLPMEPDRVVRFYNQRETAERHIGGKHSPGGRIQAILKSNGSPPGECRLHKTILDLQCGPFQSFSCNELLRLNKL